MQAHNPFHERPHAKPAPVADKILNKINKIMNPDITSFNKWIAMEKGVDSSIYSDIIFKLTRMPMAPAVAKEHLENIIFHMRDLNDKLGRNVGIHVSVCDYFSKINVLIKNPILIEESLLRTKEESAFQDELTGLFNRRYFNHELPGEIERFRRFGTSFSLLMLDLDHFKRFNDLHGYMAGDAALVAVAEVIAQSVRVYDKVVRYGGEEFAIILPQADRKKAGLVAERIRAAIEEQCIIHDGLNVGNMTVSVGVSTYPLDALDMTNLVRRADQALYVAKCRRNCVIAYFDYNRREARYTSHGRISA
jgi:diguanylate cyclase (GGDEF)-like protein